MISKKLILRQLIQYFTLFLCTYLIFVYPYDILEFLILNDNIFNISSLFFTVIIFCIIIFYFRSYSTIPLLKIFVNQGIGIGFISFNIASIALIFHFLFSQYKFQVGLTCAFLILAIVIYSYINGNKIFLKILNLKSKKIYKDVRIIFFSDLHLGSNSLNHLVKVIEKIKNIDFEFVLIGGDLIDSSQFDLKNLSALRQLNKPILFCSGNHDHYIRDSDKKLRALKDYNITYLNNSSYVFNEINVIGINDNQDIDSQKDIANKLYRKKKFNIVLIHKPSLWGKTNSYDLMLSGHTHNGQIFPFNIIVKFKFLANYGYFKDNNSVLYVSSGAGCWGPRMRLGSKNEIISLLLSQK